MPDDFRVPCYVLQSNEVRRSRLGSGFRTRCAHFAGPSRDPVGLLQAAVPVPTRLAPCLPREARGARALPGAQSRSDPRVSQQALCAPIGVRLAGRKLSPGRAGLS